MSELNVSKSHVLYGLYLSQNVGHILKEVHRLVDGHVEHVGNALALVSHFQRLPVVALAVAHLAWHHHVGQEVHLNRLVSVAAAGLAASSLDVEREASGLVAPYLCFRQVDKQRPYVAEHTRIGGRVRPRCAAKRALVYVDHLVYEVHSLY